MAPAALGFVCPAPACALRLLWDVGEVLCRAADGTGCTREGRDQIFPGQLPEG